MAIGRVARKGGAHCCGTRLKEKGWMYRWISTAATNTFITASGYDIRLRVLVMKKSGVK